MAPFAKVLVQAGVIVAIASAVGIADSMRSSRQIILERPTVEFTLPNRPNSDTPTATDSKPTQATPTQGSSIPAAPTPAASAGKSAAKPGEPGWVPTAKSALPKGQITIDEAKQAFDSGASFIDARRKDDYEAGHIKGAIRMNLASFQGGDPPLLAMVPRDGVVVVYCGGGNCDESESVAKMLFNSGYQKVFVLHDGYPGWKALGHAVETGEGMQ